MLTLFLIIALTNFKIILSVENNDTKFINSLPEKQKKEFINKVERRIQDEVPEVKYPELKDTNAEAYEKRLEDQGKSIQNILRMEIDSLKTSNRRNTNFTDRRDNPHIDLTFKTQTDKPEASRRRNEGNGLGKKYENIPVVVQYDSKYVNKYDGSSGNSSIPQNKNEKVGNTELKVDEITWDNVSLSTKPVSVNASSIEHKRTGRRSNNFDTMHEEIDNTTLGDPENSGNFSLDNNASDDVKSANITEVKLGKSTVLDSNNSRTENVSFVEQVDHTQAKTNKIIEKEPVLNQTISSSTTNNILANSGDNIETTAQYNENTQTDDKINITKHDNLDSKLDYLRTVNDSVNTNIDDLESSTSTTTNMDDVKTSENPSVNNFTIVANNVGSTETSSVNADIKKHYKTATPDRNNSNSDLLSKEDSEKQPHYVPVHNYDPENAYYNANSQQPHNSINADNTSNTIQIKETHSKTTSYDIYTDENKKSLRIMDVKERIISNDKNKQNSDLYDILTSDRSDQSSEDDVILEKPLKHTLNKIRKKLYQNKINKKSKSDVNETDIYLTEAETKAGDDSTTKVDKHEIYIGNITKLVTNFGVLLQTLVKKASKDDKPSPESKQKLHDVNEIVKVFLKDIVNYLDHKIGITQKKDAMEKIVNDVDKNNLKANQDKLSNKEHQSRFHIKGRNENYEQKKDKIHTSFDDDISEPHALAKPDKQIEKSTTQINDEYLKIHINILKDLVNRDDRGLEKYDWLGTTALVRAGLAKLQDITEKKIKHQKLHPLDHQLLDFVIELYERSKELTAKQDEPSVSSRRKSKSKSQRVTFHIPRPKHGKKFNMLNRMYTELKNTRTQNRRSRHTLVDFKEALDCLEMCLDDFHTAIKQISSITTYKKQRWYKNIKQVFLKSAKEKEYMQLLLHLVTARLVRLIDDAAKNLDSVEDNLMTDKIAVDRIQVELMLVMRICNQLMEFT